MMYLQPLPGDSRGMRSMRLKKPPGATSRQFECAVSLAYDPIPPPAGCFFLKTPPLKKNMGGIDKSCGFAIMAVRECGEHQ